MKRHFTVKDCTRDQLIQLKQAFLCGYGDPSLEDLANADELVTDDFILEQYSEDVFTEDDFFSKSDRMLDFSKRK